MWPAEPSVEISRSPTVCAEPVVLLGLTDHWTNVLLRAELLEEHHEALCVDGVSAALVTESPMSLGVPLVFVVEQEGLSSRDRTVLAWLRALDAVRGSILITRGGAAAPVAGGEWDRVLRRPVAMDEITGVVDELIGRARSSPGSNLDGQALPGFVLRAGWPWPMVQCAKCLAARHCETPRTQAELGTVRVALVTFAIAHEHCGAGGE